MQEKFDPKVFQLGYVALGTPDIQRTKDHYLQNLGMTEVARGDDGSVYLSIGYNHHDLMLRPAKEKALLQVGCAADASATCSSARCSNPCGRRERRNGSRI